MNDVQPPPSSIVIRRPMLDLLYNNAVTKCYKYILIASKTDDQVIEYYTVKYGELVMSWISQYGCNFSGVVLVCFVSE